MAQPALDVRFNRGVAPDFFDVFGARVIAGRALRDSDSTGSTQAIVVNRAFVNQLLGGANAVGRRVHYAEAGGREPGSGGTTTQYAIVGVVTDLRTNTIEPDLIEPIMYHSLRSSTQATALIRMRGKDPLQFSSRLRALTSSLDPTLRLQIVTLSRDETAADDWAPPDGARLVAGDPDRAAAVGGRHLRNDVVHRIAAPQGNRYLGCAGR